MSLLVRLSVLPHDIDGDLIAVESSTPRPIMSVFQRPDARSGAIGESWCRYSPQGAYAADFILSAINPANGVGAAHDDFSKPQYFRKIYRNSLKIYMVFWG